MPDRPPITNIATNAVALSIGTVNFRFPRHIVPIQLNTFTADGTAMISVDTMNEDPSVGFIDRKSTRLNSSHLVISYAVFCLKKKKKKHRNQTPSANQLCSVPRGRAR